jgi:hypothetical protein
MQLMPAYRDQTTFIITTDRGRGCGPTEWKDHGTDRKGLKISGLECLVRTGNPWGSGNIRRP